MRRGLFVVAALVACGGPSADVPGETADTGGPCVDAPVATWENFGAGFVTQHCQACHAGSAPDRHGAPDDVRFDSREETEALAERVLARVVDAGDMPPSGGVSADDLAMVGYWLACSE
jgi:uncharacterized membrane protein